MVRNSARVLFFASTRVLVDPAHARWHPARAAGVTPLRQAAGSEVEVFQHARARPVDVGAVLENDVDERRAEEREAAHHLGFRHRQHGRGQRIGDLVFHHLRRLAGVLGVDDDLHVGQVGQGVERRVQHGIDAGDDDEQRGQQHQEEVARRPVDQSAQHVNGPCGPRPPARRSA